MNFNAYRNFCFSPDDGGNGGGGGNSDNGAQGGAGNSGGSAGAGNNKNNGGAAGGGSGNDDDGDGGDLTASVKLARQRAEAAEKRAKKAEEDLAAANRKLAGSKTTEEQLAELQQRNSELEEERKQERLNALNDRKMDRALVEARKAGLRQDAVDAFMNLIDVDSIEHFTNPDTGETRIEPMGDFMKRFKEKHSFMFQNAGALNVNGGGGNGAGGNGNSGGTTGSVKTAKELRKLEGKPEYAAEFKKWNDDRLRREQERGNRKIQ